jgi:hypothetical protein
MKMQNGYEIWRIAELRPRKERLASELISRAEAGQACVRGLGAMFVRLATHRNAVDLFNLT